MILRKMHIIEKNNHLKDLYEQFDFLKTQIKNYKRLDRNSILRLIKEEKEYFQNLKMNINEEFNNNNLLAIYFFLKIFSNLLENLGECRNFQISWKELYYIFILETLTPETILKNTIREIKRKKSYSSKRYINRILQKSLRNISEKSKFSKSKQLKIDYFF